jgi:hypothetical protein
LVTTRTDDRLAPAMSGVINVDVRDRDFVGAWNRSVLTRAPASPLGRPVS